MPHKRIKEMTDSAQQSFNELEQLADKLQSAQTNPRQFSRVQELSNRISQQMQQIQQQAQKGQKQQGSSS